MPSWHEDDGYDVADPKSAGYADRVYERADLARKRARENGYSNREIAAGRVGRFLPEAPPDGWPGDVHAETVRHALDRLLKVTGDAHLYAVAVGALEELVREARR